jgi:Tol biopolymer transport system component
VGGNTASFSVSRQGHRLAYTESVLDTNIWRMDGPALRGGDHRPTKLIASTRQEGNPHYSPDGKRIAFGSDRSGTPEIWVCDGEGRNAVQLTSFGGPLTGAPQWSTDGRHIAFDSRPGGNPDIYSIGSEGGPPRRLTTEPSIDIVPSWSKDGRWIYFASNRTGDFQVWKLPSEGGRAVQVTKKGGSITQESPDGTFLYYAKSFYAPGIWRVPVEGGEEKPVIDDFPRESILAWAVADQGIYFIGSVKQNAGSRPVVVYFIEFFSFATGRITPFAPLEKEPESEGPAFATPPTVDGFFIRRSIRAAATQAGGKLPLIPVLISAPASFRL